MQKLNWKYKTKLEKAGLKPAKLLHAQGFQAFWVGGIVRNFLLKRESDNLDIATDATPDEVEVILNQVKIKTKPVGKRFGSILAIIDSQLIEITTFRSEGYYSDNRHPYEVKFIQEYLDDAKRRDFTINALYFDPIQKKLFDPTGKGLADLNAKMLRFVGDPKKRIDEDSLRMLRGVRLAIQLGFKLEKNSFAAIKTRAKYLQEISGERVKAELDKILLSENRAAGADMLQSTGLLRFILPEFEKLKGITHASSRYHLEGDIIAHTLRALEILQIPDINLIYAALFHDIGKVSTGQRVYKEHEWRYSFHGHVPLSGEIFARFADKYKFPREQKTLILFLVSQHDSRRWFMEQIAAEQVKFFLKQNQPELLVELWRVDSGANRRYQDGKLVWGTSTSVPAAKKVLSQIAKAKSKFHLAQGDLIMKLTSLKPGRELGAKIADVKVRIVLGKIKNEKDLQKYLQA